MILYSAQSGGFYRSEIHGNTIPGDAREVTQADYAALLDGQAAGRRIIAGTDGLPTLATPSADPYTVRLARWRTSAELSAVQLRLALRSHETISDMAPLAALFPAASNLLDLVQRYVATLPADDAAAVIWEYATRFVRGDEDTATLFSAAVGVDDDWIDDLYDQVLGTKPAA